MESVKYLKSPLNYTGSKTELMEQLLPFFPTNESVRCFYDIFAGGLSVTMNSPYTNIIANDIIKPMMVFYSNLKKAVKNNKIDEEISKILSYKIDKNDKDAYTELRNRFNESKNPYDFFSLVNSCTNNMMRFNKKMKFNQTFGNRSINDKTIEKLKNYIVVFSVKNISLLSTKYQNIFDDSYMNMRGLSAPTPEDFVYLDPPYLITEAGYNAYWSKSDEENLYTILDNLNSKNIRFLMSNVATHKNKTNPFLDKIKKYDIIPIRYDYEKVSRKSIPSNTQEIIVKNF
jgi:adenine-specific DNA-methyltransferase